ncbi:hypothetical protein DFH06DRAFT_1166746 [Mycena polygramma]|nr:hypothetical protein DFH06DRAFT_1166746 [Mycena polygramma]
MDKSSRFRYGKGKSSLLTCLVFSFPVSAATSRACSFGSLGFKTDARTCSLFAAVLFVHRFCIVSSCARTIGWSRAHEVKSSRRIGSAF